jgi:hypothetical protein
MLPIRGILSIGVLRSARVFATLKNPPRKSAIFFGPFGYASFGFGNSFVLRVFVS